MNLQKLVEACGGPGPDFDYSGEVAERIKTELGDRLSLDETIALITILMDHSLKYSDGFVVNDDRDPDKTLWLADASAIAACLSEDSTQDWRSLKSLYPTYLKESDGYRNLVDTMLKKILMNPDIQLRQPGE